MASKYVEICRAEIADGTYIDGGDVVVAQFTWRGYNDGAFGQLPATGRPASFGYCEIVRFNDQGQVTAVDTYYDQLSILAQLGHLPAPPQGAGSLITPP